MCHPHESLRAWRRNHLFTEGVLASVAFGCTSCWLGAAASPQRAPRQLCTVRPQVIMHIHAFACTLKCTMWFMQEGDFSGSCVCGERRASINILSYLYFPWHQLSAIPDFSSVNRTRRVHSWAHLLERHYPPAAFTLQLLRRGCQAVTGNWIKWEEKESRWALYFKVKWKCTHRPLRCILQPWKADMHL